MADFVLVHGAWHGGWCWSRMIERLRRTGHRASAPTLTGLGERAHLLAPHVDLDTHVQDVVAHLKWEGLRDVVLVGHSYGGMVIGGVADRVPEAIRCMVHLDAFVPVDGDSVNDLQFPERVAAMLQAAREHGDGWRIPPRSAALFGVTDPADQAWVDALTVPHPVASFAQRLRLTGAGAAVREHAYILAEHYDGSPFHALHRRLQADPAWRCYSLPTGHDAMVNLPAEVADILLEQIR